MIDPYKFLDAFVYAVRLNKLAQSVYTVYIRVMYNFFICMQFAMLPADGNGD